MARGLQREPREVAHQRGAVLVDQQLVAVVATCEYK